MKISKKLADDKNHVDAHGYTAARVLVKLVGCLWQWAACIPENHMGIENAEERKASQYVERNYSFSIRVKRQAHKNSPFCKCKTGKCDSGRRDTGMMQNIDNLDASRPRLDSPHLIFFDESGLVTNVSLWEAPGE